VHVEQALGIGRYAVDGVTAGVYDGEIVGQEPGGGDGVGQVLDERALPLVPAGEPAPGNAPDVIFVATVESLGPRGVVLDVGAFGVPGEFSGLGVQQVDIRVTLVGGRVKPFPFFFDQLEGEMFSVG
jgi:hypothetical protein